MSELKYCQGSKCHTYNTKDRIKGVKGSKYYGTRRRSSFYYGKNNFCSQQCQNDWLEQHIEQALNHFGRVTETKKVLCDQAWYKDYKYNYDHIINRSNNTHFFVNDLLGQRIRITEQQYDDHNITTPNNLSQ